MLRPPFCGCWIRSCTFLEGVLKSWTYWYFKLGPTEQIDTPVITFEYFFVYLVSFLLRCNFYQLSYSRCSSPVDFLMISFAESMLSKLTTVCVLKWSSNSTLGEYFLNLQWTRKKFHQSFVTDISLFMLSTFHFFQWIATLRWASFTKILNTRFFIRNLAQGLVYSLI